MPYTNLPTLDVNLSALVANYQLLRTRHKGGECAAVVKANAYGLGMESVAKALWQEDCRKFFVATLEEGIALRQALPSATIAVFNGPLHNEQQDYIEHNLTPVLNDRKQVEQYENRFGAHPAILHVDTGMTRLGISHAELEILAPSLPASIVMVMSHLACAHTPDHPKNAEQLERFKQATALLPGCKTSLCNSAGLFMDEAFHFQISRPGCALYGIGPVDDAPNPMHHVATLSAPIIQLRTLSKSEAIGYSSTYEAPAGARIAVVALGYADGILRYLGNKGSAYVAGHKVPIVGRVSMDMITLDISTIPDSDLAKATRAELINAQYTVNHMARDAHTIGYEIFTGMGTRIKRVYS